jgi:hypothetical protein
MSRTALIGRCLAIAVVAGGCQDRLMTEPEATDVTAVTNLTLQSATEGGISLDRARLELPSARITDQYLAELARRAINPDDYVCPPSTPVVAWYISAVTEVIVEEPAIFDLLYNQLLADLIPTYEAIYLATDDTPQYFGYNGEFTDAMLRTDKDVRRFWDIYSDDIQLIGMHGSMLMDVPRTAAAYAFIFGLPPALATFYATLVRDALVASQTLNGGDHPLFSFNAFAFTTNGGPFPDKIVMGDGMLAGLAAMGFGDVAPQAIFAHEFAHHIQFENGYFSDPYATDGDPEERTRYTELMADAMSAFYLTHKRGGSMNRKRVEQFLEIFFQIGDCAFSNPGHHGTPNQRMASARFGFDLADQNMKKGHILTSEQVHALFVAAKPDLIAPDAP